MQIFINDTPANCPENSFLQEILSLNNIQPINIAVAINDTVIPKAQWTETPVTEGSRIIIIKAVQGG